jgi:catechol 2,3-dioxygenase-like lactoylglutathione lyase family enzyme
MTTPGTPAHLDRIDHVALSVRDLASAVDWYTSKFRCKVAFARPDAAAFGALTTHRDGTRSTTVTDSAGNPVEIMAAD